MNENQIGGVTVGEAKALIGPMMGRAAENIGDFIIIARDSTGKKLGVFHTMYCRHREHEHCRVMDLLGDFIRHEAAVMYENGPQHGPGEG